MARGSSGAGASGNQQAEAKAKEDSGSQKAESKGQSTEDPKKLSQVGGTPLENKAYIIGAEDVLMVRVWREAELSGQISVRPDGKISLPLIGEIQAAGLTPESLAASISHSLTKYMNHPEVTVGVIQVNSKRYFIQGEVQKPGAYPLAVPTTVLEALVNAGGFRDFANTKKIRVMRGSQVFKFNYKEVTQGKHLEQNILLQAGDQIIVP
ncbi:MAG TPA: polysaccharide biosynthesis/export family protein [Bryobacteraceae bacterium]|nr:polysaccharide biosynthesis/export family protein [Bryobacteraceae bacterium]